CTSSSPKCDLDRPVWTHKRIRLNQPATTRQNVDQAILELVGGRMTQHLLFDMYALLNNRPGTHLLKSLPNGCQTGSGCIIFLGHLAPPVFIDRCFYVL